MRDNISHLIRAFFLSLNLISQDFSCSLILRKCVVLLFYLLFYSKATSLLYSLRKFIIHLLKSLIGRKIQSVEACVCLR